MSLTSSPATSDQLVRVIRHGRPAAVWGEADADPGLDPLGREQARAAAVALAALPAAPAKVVSSPLRRCRETAQPFADLLGAKLLIDERVGEIPTPKGLSDAERPAWLRAALNGSWDEVAGEADYPAWRAGVVAALREHGGAAVFSHFVALNAAVSAATGEARVIAFRPAHVSITTFRIAPAGLALVSLGAELQTEVL